MGTYDYCKLISSAVFVIFVVLVVNMSQPSSKGATRGSWHFVPSDGRCREGEGEELRTDEGGQWRPAGPIHFRLMEYHTSAEYVN